jgi:hypothetical protein
MPVLFLYFLKQGCKNKAIASKSTLAKQKDEKDLNRDKLMEGLIRGQKVSIVI